MKFLEYMGFVPAVFPLKYGFIIEVALPVLFFRFVKGAVNLV